jgi:hypothetical protein
MKRSLYNLRCRGCKFQGPEAEFPAGKTLGSHICPKCGSSRTFPTNEQKMHFDTSRRKDMLR